LGKKLYDIVYCDVFNAFSIPAHLTTMEFDRMVAGLLSPNGVYLINLIDILDSGRFLNACLNTARAVFPEVSVYWPVFSSRTERTTFVIIAGSRTFREDILEDAEDMAEGSLVPAHALSELAARNGRTLLTDDYAPVENLMAPVFRKAVR
jgi:spermidine synthase